MSAWSRPAVMAAVLLGACLEPPLEDVPPAERLFADPDLDPRDAPHVEDVPALAANVASFATTATYLRGYAEGEPIWYWNVDGPNATFIAPMYQVIGRDGRQIGRTIIDVLPGDPGYTPWWRIVEVYVTDTYDGERIWSRAAIDAGIQTGILRTPIATTVVKGCPVALRATKIQVSRDPTDVVAPTWVWYRNHRVHWIEFSSIKEVETDDREMPMFPVYILQRIDASEPIYEFATGVDLNGDGTLDASNNIFASPPGGPRYSPLWYAAIVRVQPDYVSVDTSSTADVGLSSETQFFDPVTSDPSPMIVPPIDDQRKRVLVNCPIQAVGGSL